jgi:hypothetical protein
MSWIDRDLHTAYTSAADAMGWFGLLMMAACAAAAAVFVAAHAAVPLAGRAVLRVRTR